MEFHLIVSKTYERQLLHFFPSKILRVQSVSEDGHCIHLQSYSSQMVSGTIWSKEKGDSKVVKGQKQQASVDSSNASSDQPQQHVPTKPPVGSNQLSVNSNGKAKQQDGCSEPSNASASQLSRVSVTSEHALSDLYHHDESSADLLDQPVFEQETPAGDDATVVPSSTKLVMQLTSKKKHTVHRVLHHTELIQQCSSCKTLEECLSNYDEGFASAFIQFLDKAPDTLQPSLEDSFGDNFLEYIKAHLQTQSCPSPCSRLWRYCADHKLFSLFKYAPEGLLIHSNSRKNAVGTVINTYLGYKDENKKLIGSGGFGKVYEFSDERAVKEEFKQPLINGSELLFQRIMGLDHPHVIKVLEYITGPENESKCFLSVMPFKNQKDLQKQFTKEKHLACVLDYMTVFQDQRKFIFRNYTVLFQHVFEGLCYLKSQGVVHRDIKSSNILVHQECKCTSPLQCMCDDDGGVNYLLGDMDLLSLEEDENLTYTLEEWQKMAGHDPAGTIGMKPPESFFRTKKGDRVTNHKSDVWSACVTMMNILIGKAVNNEAEKQITKFIAAATEHTKAAVKTLTESLNVLGSIIIKFNSLFSQMKLEQGHSGLINSQMSGLNANLGKLKQWLTSCERILHQSQSFQGGFCEIYKEENPLARILTTAHGAQVLHWKCLTKQKIYGTQLWTVMEQILDAIVAGIKFVPDRRQDATEIVKRLEKIPPVDCSDDEHKTN